MKTFATRFLEAVGLGPLLVRYHKSRLQSAHTLMKRFGTETSMPVSYSRRFQRHLGALRRLGFVEQREFTLQNRAVSGPQCYQTFCALMRSRFPDAYWSCAASGSLVVVTAPPTQMSEWRRFLSEYDQKN